LNAFIKRAANFEIMRNELIRIMMIARECRGTIRRECKVRIIMIRRECRGRIMMIRRECRGRIMMIRRDTEVLSGRNCTSNSLEAPPTAWYLQMIQVHCLP
jgi:hypothetical protein